MLGENIRAIRKKRGFTQEDLAGCLHVTRQTISKWEKGLSAPDANILACMAEVLDVSVAELLSADQIEQKNSDDAAELKEKKKQTIKLYIAAVFWFLLVQIAFGIYRAAEFVSLNESVSISLAEKAFHSILLFLPFLIAAMNVMRNGAGKLRIAELCNMNPRYRYGYLLYVLMLLFLHFNFMEGVLYMDGRWVGPAIWLERSMMSYAMLEFCHLVFAEISSVLYFAAAPLLCQTVKVEKVRQPCGSLS